MNSPSRDHDQTADIALEDAETFTALMCKTDFDYEAREASDGARVYPSEAAVRRERKCVDQCGIVEVTIKLSRIIQQENFGGAFSSATPNAGESSRDTKYPLIPPPRTPRDMESDGKISEYLFEYEFAGETWALTIEAASEREARDRVLAMAGAEMRGVIAEKVPQRTATPARLVYDAAPEERIET